MTGANTNTFICYGFEIINEASQITIPAGSCYSDGRRIDVDAALLDYKLGFENVADLDVGTRGGRAVIAVDKEDGQVKKYLTKVDASAAYLTSADHTNEIPYRDMHFREFGRNAANDFTAISTSSDSIGFLLDDGSTELHGRAVRTNGAGFSNLSIGLYTNSTSWLNITFTGTGLDVIGGSNVPVASLDTQPANGATDFEVVVDGTLVGSISANVKDIDNKRVKICSGLPYGTHTVRILRNTATSWTFHIKDIIAYQPKKPSVPQDSVELGEYNILADFQEISTNGTNTIASGILRKMADREAIYKGGGWSLTSDIVNNTPFWFARSVSINDEFTRNFFGTGFDYRAASAVGFAPIEIYVNDTLLTAANFPGASFSVVGGSFSFNDTTGILTTAHGSTAQGCSFNVTGLDLDSYTVRFVNTTGATMLHECFDAITPIHTPHVVHGSMSIRDLRQFESDTTNKITKDFRTYATWTIGALTVAKSVNISQIYRRSTGDCIMWFENAYVDRFYDASLAGTPSTMLNISRADGNTVLSSYKHQARILNYLDTGGLTNGGTNSSAGFVGKLQKDFFDDSED